VGERQGKEGVWEVCASFPFSFSVKLKNKVYEPF
jgi:hypothetical protein